MPDLEFYDGASTGQQIDEAVQKGIITVNCGTISSLPATISNANILASHVVLNADIGYPFNVVKYLTVTTENGSLTISGNIVGSITLVLTLGRSN